MKTRQLFIGVMAVLMVAVVTVAITMVVSQDETPTANITNFEECKQAGYLIMESYPEQCRTPDGELFVRVIEEPIEEPIPTLVPTVVSFATDVLLERGSQISFSDGLSLTLIEINDSRCQADVECIWAGELSALVRATGGSFSNEVQEIRLGTTNDSSVTLNSYVFTLVDATETAATISVIKSIKPPVASDGVIGTVQGHVTIGPICPVEREGVPCEVPSEVYTSRTVVVYAADQNMIITRKPLDAIGNFVLTLAPGTYWLQIQPAGIGAGEKKQVLVRADETITIDFDIDTGIR